MLRQRRRELTMQIAVDLDHRHQQRQPETEREHDARRQRAAAVDVGNGKPQHCRAHARQTARNRHGQHRDQPKRDEDDGGGADEDRGEAAVVGEQDRQSRESGDDERRGDDVARPRPSSLGGDLIAEQTRHRNIVRASERPQGEGKCGQQAIGDRQRQHREVQRRLDRQRDHRAEDRCDGERQRRAESGADERGEQRDDHDLRAVDGEHAGARGAKRLHGRDRLALAREMAGDRVGNADAADEKRGQSDQRQELAEALDIAFELRRRLVAGADIPAGIGKLRLRLFFDRRHGGIARCGRGQAQPILPAHQAAGLQEAGGAQRRVAHQDARPKADAAGEFVRFGGQRRAKLDHRIADGDPVAGLEIEPRRAAPDRRQRRMCRLVAPRAPRASSGDRLRPSPTADRRRRPP